MRRRQLVNVGLAALASLILVPTITWAQIGIAGVVKDTTGAVLPGVTVEAASPALIEKVRTVVSDSQGQYKMTDLRPGVYAVTFALVGFSTVRREGIELKTDFTAQVNAEMRVGGQEETITVTGASPVVDVQNVVQSKVVTKEIVEAIPNTRTMEQIATLIPGMTIKGGASKSSGQDVGGTGSEGRQRLAIHGGIGQDAYAVVDGLPHNTLTTFSTNGLYTDSGAFEEFGYAVGGISAETPTGGVLMNTVPKDGGNRFNFTLYTAYTDHHFTTTNVSDNLKRLGVITGNSTNKIWDANPSGGGPLKRDKLWFYGSARYWGHIETVTDMWYAKDPRAFVFTPDKSRPALDNTKLHSESLRLTWQPTKINKISAFLVNADRCVCHALVSATRTPEATTHTNSPQDRLAQVTWSAPVTNRLLLEAGANYYEWNFENTPHFEEGLTENFLSVREKSTGLVSRATPSYAERRDENTTYNSRGALSYITGSHDFKVGFTMTQGHRANLTTVNGDLDLVSNFGVPNAVTSWTTPYTASEHLNALGLYAQDKWTLKRLTVSAGVRFDRHNAGIPDQHLLAVQFVGPRNFAAIHDLPNWKDVNPRLGAAYDLFGTGKTALKATLSRYVNGDTTSVAGAINPIISSVNSATRTWNDSSYPVGDPRRDNFLPDCDFLNPLPNGECSVGNPNFGKVDITTQYDVALRTGWFKRPVNWETSATIQQELGPKVSATATYTRRWYDGFRVTDNRALHLSDYSTFCVTAPVDARLPNGGGNQICGLYDLNPDKVLQVADKLVTTAATYGKMSEHWNGVDLTVNARLPRGVQIAGGMSIGRTVFDACDLSGEVDQIPAPFGLVVDQQPAPSKRTCHAAPPFKPQVKLNGIIPLRWGLQTALTYQGIPGPEITAQWNAPNSEVVKSLGRSLSAGATATTLVQLITPGTMYAGRLHQVDARFTKIIRVGKARINGNFDVYNLFNASPILILNTTYAGPGDAWQQPSYILPARLLKFGATIEF